MCDYSLHHVASRPANVGDKLVTTKFVNTPTGGFAAVDNRQCRGLLASRHRACLRA